MGQNATTLDSINGRRHSMSPCSVTGRYTSTLNIPRRSSLNKFRKSASTVDLDQKSINRNSSGHDQHCCKPRESMLVEQQLVNINTASEEQLMTLSGVDRVAARAIVQRRHLMGPFEELNDLVAVPGVGKKKLKRIRSEISTSSSDCGCRDSVDSGVFASPPPHSEEIPIVAEP